MKGKCEHNWHIISIWGVKTFFARRYCKKCERTEESIITFNKWSESNKYE